MPAKAGIDCRASNGFFCQYCDKNRAGARLPGRCEPMGPIIVRGLAAA